MKALYLYLSLLFYLNCYSQDDYSLPKNPCTGFTEIVPNFKTTPSVAQNVATDFVYDCNTVFWTVNALGEIQQWDLIENQVTGGTIILTNSGLSLAFCGSDNDLTFHSTQFPVNGLMKYNLTTSTWDYIPVLITSPNCGGFYEHQYFLNSNNTGLIYYNPPIWINVPDSQMPLSNAYRVADVAVDANGRAWAFTGPNAEQFGMIETVMVFDTDGVVASYPLTTPIFNEGAYGSFFINDQLYIGILDEIIPINIFGAVASPGDSISFPYNNYADLASCNKSINLGMLNHNDDKLVTVYPNPTKDILNIDLNEEVKSMAIYTVDGKLIKTVYSTKSIDIAELATATYLLKIISEKKTHSTLIIKE